ncbi:MAG: MFS transporter [Thermodesulfobacteriota bacterium]
MIHPLALMFFLAFLVFVDVRILVPVLPSISQSLDASAGTVGLSLTAYSFAYGIGQLFYGPLSDRLGRIAVIRAAGVGFGLCTILSAFSVTMWQFILVRLLAGALAGAVIPLTLVFIGDTVAYERRQSVLGLFAVVNSSAMALSASIGGTVAFFVSWRLMLLGYGVLALLPAGLMWRVETPAPCLPEGGAERFTDLLRNRYALFVYAAVFFQGVLLWGAMTYIGAFAVQRYRIDQFEVGLLIALFGCGTLTGGLLMGRIRRHISEKSLALWGGVMMGVSLLVFIPNWPAAVFAAGMLVLGLGYVCLHTTLQLRGTQISSTARGKAFSLFTFSLFSGISIGSAVFGWLVDGGRSEAMLAIAGAGMACVGLATAIAPQGRAVREPKVVGDVCILQ